MRIFGTGAKGLHPENEMLRVFTRAKIRYLGLQSTPGPAPKALDRVPDPQGGRQRGGRGQGSYKPHTYMLWLLIIEQQRIGSGTQENLSKKRHVNSNLCTVAYRVK